MTGVDGAAVDGSSSSVTRVDGPKVGGSSSSVTRVDWPMVGCASSVTAAAAKSSLVKMFASYGHSPHMLKPVTALEGAADRRNAFGGCGRSNECLWRVRQIEGMPLEGAADRRNAFVKMPAMS